MSSTVYQTTLSDDGLKRSLIASGLLHLIVLLFLYFGLPHLMPPLTEHHPPVPFEIVELADITNTRIAQPEPPKPQEAPPPKPHVKSEPTQTQPQPAKTPAPPVPPKPIPPPDQAEALKPIAQPKPKTPEAKPQQEAFSKLLKNLENKKPDTPKSVESKADSHTTAQAQTQAPTLSNRLTISEEDALRRQISQCWNMPIGARDAQNLIVEISIDVNPDRTVQHAEIVDKARAASDPFFRAAAEAALRALYSPLCTPLELPPDKYQQWKHIDFTFDPRDML